MNFRKFKTTTIAKRICKCGNLITFEKPYPATCKICGELVYLTRKMETIAKIKKEMKKR